MLLLGCVFFLSRFYWTIFDWQALVESIFQTGIANVYLSLGEGVYVIKCTMSRGKAKVLSKKPCRTFICIKLRVCFKAIHHCLDEHATLPVASPSSHPAPAAACPSLDSWGSRSHEEWGLGTCVLDIWVSFDIISVFQFYLKTVVFFRYLTQTSSSAA